MIEKLTEYDLRLDEDAKLLLDEWPRHVERGFGWLPETETSRKHFPPGFLGDYRRLVIGGRSRDAHGQIEELEELAEMSSAVLAGVAVSDDNRLLVVVVDMCEPDWDASDPRREALTEFLHEE
jgi:hypothetical protein